MFIEPEEAEFKPIRVDENGNWFHGDAPIIHPKIVLYFLKHVKYQAEDDSWWISTPDETHPLEVSHTPFFVTSVLPGEDPDTLLIRLNDGETELLDLDSVRAEDMNSVYCRIRNGRFRARFDPDAMRRLGRNLKRDENGTFYLQVGSRRVDIS